MALENGHSSPMEMDQPTPPLQPSHSDSDLSDVNDTASTHHVLADAHHDEESGNEDVQDMATSPSDGEEDAAGSEDADYAAPESPPSPQSNESRRNSTSSESSSQSRKRKVDVDDEQYMQKNPELYGLRRSVRGLYLLHVSYSRANSSVESRPPFSPHSA